MLQDPWDVGLYVQRNVSHTSTNRDNVQQAVLTITDVCLMKCMIWTLAFKGRSHLDERLIDGALSSAKC